MNNERVIGINVLQSVKTVVPVPLDALLGAPQGSLFLEAPSPKGSLDAEESMGGAGDPHASSVLIVAAAEQRNRGKSQAF